MLIGRSLFPFFSKVLPYIMLLPVLSMICQTALPDTGDTIDAFNSFNAGLGETVITPFVTGNEMLMVFEYLNEPFISATFNL